MVDRLRENEQERRKLFSEKERFSEHLYKWTDARLPDKYDANSYEYTEGLSFIEIEDARDAQLERGADYVKFVGNVPCGSFEGFEACHDVTMVLSCEPDWQINDALTFRKPTPEELIGIELKHYGAQYGEDFATRNITRNQEKLSYIGAYLDGKLVGTCFTFTTGEYTSVDGLLVDKDHRNQRIGTSLLLEGYRRAGGIYFLHADAEDTPCQMYEKLGFVVKDHIYEYFEKFQPAGKKKAPGEIRNITIVSLSDGKLGEEENRHMLKLGTERLLEMGLNVSFGPNALKGRKYIKDHPEARARDLLDALIDGGVDMILCAIGGMDTYRLLPYLFEQDRLKKMLRQKIFLGFSDSTINHLMLYKCGLNTFYGQSFLGDICELDLEMLPYSKKYFEELIRTGTIAEIRPAGEWYEERTDRSEAMLGTSRIRHEDRKGFELLQGASRFEGKILGGCLESIYDLLEGVRHKEEPEMGRKYGLFPSIEEWKGKILLLETSGIAPEPEQYREELKALKRTGLFETVNGILCGKPMDEKYYEEYKRIIVEVVDDPALPIVANINIGHATPRCIIPFGVDARVDTKEQVIRFSMQDMA